MNTVHQFSSLDMPKAYRKTLRRLFKKTYGRAMPVALKWVDGKRLELHPTKGWKVHGRESQIALPA